MSYYAGYLPASRSKTALTRKETVLPIATASSTWTCTLAAAATDRQAATLEWVEALSEPGGPAEVKTMASGACGELVQQTRPR